MRLLLDCGRSLAGVSRSQVPLLTFFQAYFRIFRLICSKAAKQQGSSSVSGHRKCQAKSSQTNRVGFVLALLFVWLCRRVVFYGVC